MKAILVLGTRNEVERSALEKALAKLKGNAAFSHCEIFSVDTDSGVRRQPVTYTIGAQGAYVRASAALDTHRDKANDDVEVYGIGVQNCVDMLPWADDGEVIQDVVTIFRSDDIGTTLRTMSVELPPKLLEYYTSDKRTTEHEEPTIAEQLSVRSGGKDEFDYLSGGVVNREQLLTDTFAVALAQLAAKPMAKKRAQVAAEAA